MNWWHNGVATAGVALESTFGAMIALLACHGIGTCLGVIVMDPSAFSFGIIWCIPAIFAVSLFTFLGVILYAYIVIAFVVMAHSESIKLKAGMLLSALVLSSLNAIHMCYLFRDI